MAILASANWYVRAGGNALNGGGYDSAISGAGTNYCDQDAAQLSLTDFATSGAGSTTLTSATGGFTSAMIGNCIRIASGTNFQAGYYFVTARTDTNTVTLDRTPTSGGAGSGGTGRLGGAFATTCDSLSIGGSAATPTITSPLAPGHTVNVRGGGSDTPATADYTQTGWAQYPSGDLASDRIKWIGYNGRPRIDLNHLYIFSPGLNFVLVENFLLKATAVSPNPEFGMICSQGDATCIARNVRFDQAGYDTGGCINFKTINCEFVNTGGGAAGTYPAAGKYGSVYPTLHVGNLVNGWRGGGFETAGIGLIIENVIANCGGRGIDYRQASAGWYQMTIRGNTIYGNGSDGIRCETNYAISTATIQNNVLVGNGGYGINNAAGSIALNDSRKVTQDYNAFYNNTSGARNGISAGAHDVTLSADPFTNAAGGDFTLNSTAGGGAALKGVAFPTSIP